MSNNRPLFEHKLILWIVVVIFMATAVHAGGRPMPPGNPGDNIALGCPYTWNYDPNYSYCTDSGDTTQLTDGVYSGYGFWTFTTTVGWVNMSPPVEITIDLGVVQPIQGVSYSTAGGVAGVQWPTALHVQVSNDGINFYEVVDLVTVDPPPAYGTYNTHCFDASNLTTHGRYVRFSVTQWNCVFVDEIKIYRGANTLLGQNIALGRSYTFDPVPNYPYCTDSGDTTQLTDGVYSNTTITFWGQLSAVGWSSGWTASTAAVTIDLGQDQPIEGVSFNTVARLNAGVTWPDVITIMVSNDNVNYYNAGELISLSSAENGFVLPPDNLVDQVVNTYWTDRLVIHGRYVKIIASNYSFIFVDEIEVYRGRNAMLSEPYHGNSLTGATAINNYVKQTSMATRRIVIDALNIQQQVATDPQLTPLEKGQFNLDLMEIVQDAIYQNTIAPATFQVVLPINNLHAQVFNTQAALWRAQGHSNLTAWAAPLWDTTPPTLSPDGSSPDMSVTMMQGEFKSGAFNLSNATDSNVTLNIRIEDLPGGTNPSYIEVQASEWIDTAPGIVNGSPLPDATIGGNGFNVSVPSGMTRQIWLTFNPATIPPGTYQGTIVVDGGSAGTVNVPIQLRLSPLAFPEQPTLGLGGWDYTNRTPYGVLTTANYQQFIQLLNDYFVDTPWASNAVMPLNDLTPTTFTAFDAWYAQWPNARNYRIFLNVPDSFGGYAINTPGFNTTVRNWLLPYLVHWESLGIDPTKIGLELVDEPNTTAQSDTTIAWANAIKDTVDYGINIAAISAEWDIIIWINPDYPDPSLETDLFNACDTLTFNLSVYLSETESFKNVYRNSGKTLNFYACNGPIEHLDLYSYYRLQAWHCWYEQASAMFFWSFADQGGLSSWKTDYTQSRVYSPLFIEPDKITAGKGMKAIRDGVEDYEYLRMLKDRIAVLQAGGNPPTEITAAQTLLANATDTVLNATNATEPMWMMSRSRSVADSVRIDVLDMLETLAPQVGDNIALGCPYTWNYNPNYLYCTDSGDSTQLTDGIYMPTTSSLWGHMGTVGWANMSPPVEITIDLGSIQPIQGVSYSTAGGVAGVQWPTALHVQVSNDGVNFYEVVDLVTVDPPPAYGTYNSHCFNVNNLITCGRYVRFSVEQYSFVFVDEIEVYRGSDALLGQNLALGRSYTWNYTPNYSYCTDSGDTTQLTDGVYSGYGFWTLMTTVGWANMSPPVEITIDLETVQPIQGVSYSTAGGVAGVQWPTALHVKVSNDGVNFSEVVDLVTVDPPPAYGTYNTHRFNANNLSVNGRYVRFSVEQWNCVFIDEIEIYRGSN